MDLTDNKKNLNRKDGGYIQILRKYPKIQTYANTEGHMQGAFVFQEPNPKQPVTTTT